ncbi:unnamed protein product [Tetraodon nigroviridis]|uniref:(spotted green pufferfish) hypothetical protein n=1 Tax=Tetraodon nigroviridis TaxID=99883 RepID=Q4TDA7_TETNG|nr:unnamed protein product [Tetraodon nigroviridis]
MNLLTSTQAELKESKQRCAAEENLRKQQEERSKQEIDQLREELQQLQVSNGENRERKQQEERGWEEIDQLREELQQLQQVSKAKNRERRRGFWKRIQRLWKN